ncbi:TetR/AcrR family transcriptional regulator [Novosphingobium sp.]|uniref:TetR/AcrR family transcriptional regulator n=1 Tax=Novosphingobium sp. TaxID=1874826 RepID=UPI0025DE0FB2|nr:TetR/AcrR family transcriptional regulator [Novosphingobium sp.]MCC6925352.1 TetR/AcrR family transcriptional regulator [Novosphingobium sp.]
MPRPSVPTRRADILLAARDVFNARGYAGTRMDDIARAAGISKAALYLQFDGKEALFQALVNELIETMLPQAAPAEFGDLPAEAILRQFILFMASRLTQPEMAFVPRVIIGEGANFPDLARFYHEEVISRGMGIVERIVRHGIARGEFACDDPVQACRTIIGGVLIAAIWKTTFEPVGAEPIEPAAMAQSHADTILNGLLTRTTTL